MFEKEKQEVIDAGTKLDRYGLIALSGGNISLRLPDEEILMTPSGMVYEDLSVDDIIVTNLDGKVIEGKRRPSVDNVAIRHIFKERKDINAIIHTHQPYATAIGLVTDEIQCNLTTLANAVRGPVKVAPYSSAASIDMGIQTVENLGDQLAVVLKHHGVVGVGDSLKQALYSTIYLEEGAKTLVMAHAYGGNNMATLTDEQVQTAVGIFEDYGQK
ncbi:class II aldolase/adducin family protein [Tetragenococcus halophilus]|uniref:Class II aldolase/adducin family protein n=1 Tax=Tetragenococcus halophilus TaxID=51669 RepID=A0A3G5FHJ1_TETHA|nr:class II aldolase/adducin family protein [Tetragenococcus halophilus]AYW49705.1 class II aldolase/adducin family protein [Tetragenococcus halophilus]MCO8285127.1 class II aldolase/adducin family protein [Tetragenococcus halophilus]GBD64644.1 putative sugar-phosphate aldolase [Tetragenococcus halophilus subsp. flandriensis]GBD66175.1 putative sugar-phosphate aldolase [Tetragenococcus halophilus subsp. halophilus]GBD73910.1 putative sugar-phosphate aldolase [Tetragenococcus halophilus subsp. 